MKTSAKQKQTSWTKGEAVKDTKTESKTWECKVKKPTCGKETWTHVRMLKRRMMNFKCLIEQGLIMRNMHSQSRMQILSKQKTMRCTKMLTDGWLNPTDIKMNNHALLIIRYLTKMRELILCTKNSFKDFQISTNTKNLKAKIQPQK